MDRYKAGGHIAMLSAGIVWGLMSPISKIVFMSGEVSGLTLATMRVTGAAIAFWIASLFVPNEKVPPRDLFLLFIASLLSITFNQSCFVIGLSYTTPIDATVVATTTPIITMILAAIVLKEPLTSKKALGVFMGLSGALMLILSGAHAHGDHTAVNSVLGDTLCFIAQCSFSCYLVFFKNFISKYSSITLMKWMFLFATLCVLPFDFKELTSIPYAELSMPVYAGIAYVVLMGTFFAYLMIPIGQKRLRPTTMSMYNYTQPVTASLLSIYWGMDNFSLIKAIAIVLVFLGVYVVTQSKSRAQVEAEERALKAAEAEKSSQQPHV